jgi:hypothetical protein
MGYFLVVDRIEGEWAVVEYSEKNTTTFNVPIKLLPEGIKEGDIIELTVSIRRDETIEEKKKLHRLIDENMFDG